MKLSFSVLFASMVVRSCAPIGGDGDGDGDGDGENGGEEPPVKVFEDGSGARVEVPEDGLPDGVSLDDLEIEFSTGAPANPADGVAYGFTPVVTMQPHGLRLSKPVRLTLPVGVPNHRSTTVNPQITDAVAQANTKVLADAPAMALSSLYQTASQASSFSAQNAVTSQQQANIVLQATTTQGVSLLYGIDTSSTAVGIAKILNDQTSQDIASLPTPPAALAIGPDMAAQINGTAAEGARRDGSSYDYPTFEFVEVDGRVEVHFETHMLLDGLTLTYNVIDSDGNGIHDFQEGIDDYDGDGVMNLLDWDNDGDRVADELEGDEDPDGDGHASHLDTDANGDGTDDGKPHCETTGTCTCAFRDAEGVEEICYESPDAWCEDIDEPELGLYFEVEIIPEGGCPLPVDSVQCTDDQGELAVYYKDGTGQGKADFCQLCDGDTTPSGFCP